MPRRTFGLVLLTLAVAGPAPAQTGAATGTTPAPVVTAPAPPLSPSEFQARDAILIPFPDADVPPAAPEPVAPAAAAPASPIVAPAAPAAPTPPATGPASPTTAAGTKPQPAPVATPPSAPQPLPPVASSAPPASPPPAPKPAPALVQEPVEAPAEVSAPAAPAATAPPLPETLEAGVPAAPPEPAPPAEPPPTPTVRFSLQPLSAQPNGDVLLQGEEPTASFVVPVPAGIGAGTARLEIVYRNGIDMLPEQSSLSLSIDGKPVDTIEPTAFGEAKTWSVPVVLTGQDELAVQIAARQSHRLLCGPQASYELWTAIDLARSGLVVDMPEPLLPATIGEALGALQLAIAARLPLTLVPAGPVDDPGHLKPLIDAAQALGLRADRTAMRLLVAAPGAVPTPDPDAPLAAPVVVVGAAADVAGALPALGADAITGPTLTLVPPPGGGPSVLVATGRTPDEVLAAVRRLAPDDPTAAASGPVLADGGRYELARLGMTDRDVRAHRERIDIDFRLPSDLYAADGSPVRFRLDAAYAPGLGEGSALTMTVNGIPTGIVRLSKPSGELLQDREIDLPFRLFRPGDNRVSVELAIPVATPDRPCPPMTDKDDPLFTLFASSSLDFPAFAHLQELPDLRLFSDGGVPYSTERAIDLVLPALDGQSLSAAATLAARLAAAAGRPLAFEPAVAWPRSSSRDKIIVAPVDALADDMLGGADLRRRDLIASLPLATELAPDQASADQSVEDLVARMTAERRAVEPAIPGEAPAPVDSAAETAPADDSAARQSAWEARLDAAEEPSWYDRILLSAEAIVSDVEARLTDQTQGETASQFLAGLGGVPRGILLQYPALQSSGTAITLLTAADPSSLAGAAADLATDKVWPQLRGDLVAFGGALTEPAIHTPTKSWNTMAGPLTAEGAVRLAAHWLSKHNAIWLGLILGLSLLAAIVTRLLLNRIGVRDAG
jgi:hypothetical protein